MTDGLLLLRGESLPLLVDAIPSPGNLHRHVGLWCVIPSANAGLRITRFGSVTARWSWVETIEEIEERRTS